MTKNGKIIFDIIENSHSHPTAEEIFLEVKKRSPKTVMATVYNNLNALVKEGAVQKIKTGGTADRYDKTSRRHDHLVCDVCGEISDVFLGDLTALLAEMAQRGINSYSLVMHYVCDSCKNGGGKNQVH